MNVAEKWRKFVNAMNDKGIPVPTLRDPATKRGSVSFTMVGVSFGLMTVCVVLAMCMVVNKWAGIFITSDESINALKEAFFMALQMAGLSVSLYFGRKFQRDEKGALDLGEGKSENAEKDTPPV